MAGCLKARMIDVLDLGLQRARGAVRRRGPRRGSAGDRDLVDDGPHRPRGERRAEGAPILRERKLEARLKIIVGGAAYRWDHDLYKAVEADAWAENGILAADVVCALIREVPQ